MPLLYLLLVRPSPPRASFTQLTDQPGPELFPSLSPDGKSVIYASPAAGNWDIYLQRVGGKKPVNLTADSRADDTQSAFSPDGERIVFRSERDGGGIFVMGATGESVRRVTNVGYNPAWSPEGKEIVFATEAIEFPAQRFSTSQLWVVNLESGQKRQIATGDAVQPHWSPHGYRIAYWGVHKRGPRNIWTVAAGNRAVDKGEPVLVTDDEFTDWNPVWSPDGRYLYFSSDRGGSMNLWRVPIEERTGSVLGPPDPVTTPSPYSGHISLARDGHHIAFSQHLRETNLYKVVFDPLQEAVVGQPISITQGSTAFRSPKVSPDGQWLTFASGGKQEDIFVMRVDGSGLRQLTDDPHKDRAPRWSSDGKRIVFYSSRSGKYEAWAVNADGSGLRQLTYTSTSKEGVFYPDWSPDGTRLVYNLGRAYIMDVTMPWKEQSPQALPPWGGPGETFVATSWSPDGRTIAGHLKHSDADLNGIVTYALDSRQFQKLTDSGDFPIWLQDSRRLLFEHEGKIYLVDSRARKILKVLALPPHTIGAFGLSRDDRLLCFGLFTFEADVWLATLE